jgi:gluconolactonase
MMAEPRWIVSTTLWCAALLATLAHGEPLSAGKITRYAKEMDAVIAPDARIEKLADGFTWAEGPTWVAAGGHLLFTDVPENTMYRWSQKDGLSVFLKPSGYAGAPLAGLREAGANGLLAEPEGTVLLADSGSRLVARLELQTKRKKTLIERYGKKRFNSPNDLARKRDGTIFFTDPPYGLKDLNASPLKEQAFNGVYRLDLDGSVHVIDDSLTFPNGIALSPDERTLYVANSDPNRPIWMAYTLSEGGEPSSKRVFADASDLTSDRLPGLPDGMKVASNGIVFATGPGGVLVFTPQGQRLGRIETGLAIANCAFGDDGRTLYMTSHKILARVRLLIGL